MHPQLGRVLTDAEDRAGVAECRVLVSGGLWRSHFNAAPDVIDRVVTLDGRPLTVNGVMPGGVDFPGNARGVHPALP
jgi:putative ABC transport system permease protein